MLYKNGSKICVMFALLVSTAIVIIKPASAGYSSPQYSVFYGMVYRSPLEDFTNDFDLKKVCVLLRHRQFLGLHQILDKETSKVESDPVAVLALAQLSPQWAKAESERLIRIGSSLPNNDKIRLGIVSFYYWASIPTSSTSKSAPDLLKASAECLGDIWQQSHNVLAGLLLVEIFHIRPTLEPQGQSKILEELIERLSGHNAFPVYQRAETKHWPLMLVPPGNDLIPAENRAYLAGVLKSVWSDNSSRVSLYKVVDGKTILVPQPFTDEQIGKKRYVDAWIKRLEKG